MSDPAKKPCTVCLTIFVFRGEPDAYYNRHVILYFTSPDLPDFHQTVHTQRESERGPWRVHRLEEAVEWALEARYLSHVNAGAVRVHPGLELAPVAVVATTPVHGRDKEGDWNCQNFVLEGLQSLVDHKLQTKEWYDAVESELMDQLFEGAID
jgi:hypothetical protein